MYEDNAQRYPDRRKLMVAMLTGGASEHFCYWCGGEIEIGGDELPATRHLTFDHLLQTDKTHDVSRLVLRGDDLTLIAEVKKCVLACRACNASRGNRVGPPKRLRGVK